MSDPRYSIKVAVSTRYLPEQSQEAQNRFAFAYDVTITNEGSLPAQLHARHWIITDGNGRTQEVRGAGVVGEQPVLAPGATHQYSSGTVLETRVGSMRGSYQMEASDGHTFDAVITPFRLAVPGSLH
ncbi:Co2+/Mg2+ efflux protein ApaG [Pseudomonas sp. WAC2]|uniref:Co2+/Mg2+ efflux protein ApaG n=1 Tax=Pseudomonas sp. WAC2 TaxID=3055057 RepID=UPI0025AEDF4A|nr:Co2+/Mg2+ efflux protein ApaG [Pseudomonas sp. WAC2]MDN3237126.1 Co2+/Mg2+ efflux protein ApaG [Pseudomonas sp. WAC2]